MKEDNTITPTDIKKTKRKYYDQNHFKNFATINEKVLIKHNKL